MSAAGPGREGWLELPEGWSRSGAAGAGGFVTHEILRRPDGAIVKWNSRAHRKRSSAAATQGRLSRWMGGLFMIGSACFALAAAPGFSSAVAAETVAWVFFAGSVFFTGAATLQFLEVVNTHHGPEPPSGRRRLRLVSWEPRRIDWWATLVQLAGTLYFNASTFHATEQGLSASGEDLIVWRPDVLGSICFLLASGLAWAEVCHGAWRWRPASVEWRIAAWNMLGSILFGLSAIGSYVIRSTGEVASATLANGGTCLGALCFLFGGYLLLPESRMLLAAPRPAVAT